MEKIGKAMYCGVTVRARAKVTIDTYRT